MLHEKELKGFSGWLLLFLLLLAGILGVVQLINFAREDQTLLAILMAVVALIALVCLAGLTVINPNEARVVTLFGVYKGSLKHPGFWWVNPLTTRRLLSLRVRNFESGKLKVNDRDGNPIEIAAIVVWRIVETFEAAFNVDDYEHFVHVQSESALRVLATSYPYDSHMDEHISLRQSVGEVAERLRTEIHERLAKA